MTYVDASIIGSGTSPHLQLGPAHNFPVGSIPVPDGRDKLRIRKGQPAIIVNPQDFSATIGVRTSQIDVSTVAVSLVPSPQEYRRAILIHNNGPSTLYIGDSTVTVSNGIPLATNEKIAIDIQGNPNTVIYGVTAGSCDVRILEVA